MSDPQGCEPTTPRKCARGCGFFGLPENKFLCSKCYNDYLKEEIAKSAAVTLTSTSTMPKDSTANPFSWVTGGVISTTNTASDSTAAPAKSNRCLCCKKKVGVMSFWCRCGGVFCGRHRYPEEHQCAFDFKALGRSVLAKENPVFIANKLRDRV